MTHEPMWRRIQRMIGSDLAGDAADEMEYHIDSRTRELVASGMDPEEARAEALRRFGDVDRVRSEVVEIDRSRERRSGLTAATAELWQDLRIASRALRRSPGFALAAILTLALGMGANVAVFSAINSIVLRPLPFQDPDRLVMLWEENPERGWYMQTAAASNVLDWRERVDAFDDVAAYASFDEGMALTGEGAAPRIVATKEITGNFFSVLGVTPEAGRLFRFEETWSDSERGAVLSHDAWQSAFGGSPDAIGQTIRLDGMDYTVIGALPASFRFPDSDADVWLNIGWDRAAYADASFRRAHWLRAVARLEPGVSLDQAAAQLDAVATQLQSEFPGTNRLMGAGMTPLHEFLLGDTTDTLLIILAAVGVLLLLACANIGNLLLVKALTRRREIAVRRALGASPWRLIRQTFAEGLLLAGIGAIVALALAWVILEAIGAAAGSALPEGAASLTLDGRLAGYLLIILTVATIIFGMIPGIVGARADAAGALKEGGRSGGRGEGGRRAAKALVMAEVALALLLVTGAALLGRSFLGLRDVPPGFDARDVFTAAVVLPAARYASDEEVISGFAELRRRAEALPGVESVAAVRQLPLTTASWSSDFSVDGRAPDAYGVEVLHREVMPGYFQTMRIPLLQGRSFADGDRSDAEPVIIINQALADQYFPDQSPLGARLAFSRAPDADARWWTVVGVVGNERQASPADPPRPEIFAPVTQDVTRGMTFVLRTSADPASLAGPLRDAVATFDPELVLDDVRTMAEVRDAATSREAFLTLVFAGFAVVALLMALVGVYGVMARMIRSRRREIGIRLALGSAPGRLVALLTRQSLELLLGGIVAGLVLTMAAVQALSTLLYGIEPRDPLTLTSTALLLLIVGLAAAAIPAVRAGGANAVDILKEE